jgi:hypothetical protein
MELLTPSENDNTAWERAWRTRCCPPDVELYRGEETDMLSAHLTICPWCRADQIDILPSSSLPEAGPRQFSSGPPRAGELWLVNPELGGWGEKSRYYNGPLVLVLEDTDERTVNVLQIYHDDYFRGPDDVPLDREPDHVPAGFAEPWNRYSLCREDLAFRLAAVTEDVLERCRAAAKGPAIDIEQGSLLWFFRNMEVEAGFYFARQSIAKVLRDTKATGQEKPTRLDSVPAGEVVRQLRRLALQCKKSLAEDATPFDVLACCSLPDDRLPLAAADTNQSSFALVFIFEAGRLESYTTSTFTLHQTAIEGNSLLVSGTLPDEAVDFDEFHCWWEREGKMIPADQGSAGYADRVFWATFSLTEPIQSQEKYEIVIRCIKYI